MTGKRMTFFLFLITTGMWAECCFQCDEYTHKAGSQINVMQISPTIPPAK